MCTQGKVEFFNDKSTLYFAKKFWKEIPERHPHVTLGAFEFVHNHMHGIITIIRDPKSSFIDRKNSLQSDAGASFIDRGSQLQNDAPASNQHTIPNHCESGSIGAILQGYKMITKRMIRFDTKFRDFDWQRDFWDHIIRNQKEYSRITRYIEKNLERWERDRHNPISPNFTADEISEAGRLPWNTM
ncbi:MAG: hypothetical protein A2268_08250 [Candidatus Raymondbacteria bacterium RifOxyA12_full_50_37]|uniref:Transposase IS200-like domain-containing protein n=1 Tax=Candidatus Raymondbacteria bacterium RIFOXYD12_FULL_49_13 TaxID=1817890 RepID=A0A1F7FEZ6_UNCRA|nr:MAG: hypothetical protein A2268_08250 [Candidatus Raymondbacteria bacterium RifOxyA12_full_50_37]OGJ92846.1 MAG: hypothetical protein A2248_07040 [Candidatus Raymondbacteria bacterium RIFOXYA2_FULL_49_16]OGJ94127.1 MAG: hypothetical protein A2487_16300 [Candidatus Raymondbacteria bacterium RifOxyC12_full_50_8]OGJ99138.1 MAG: hypothetical protein A2453_09185 [Candidatus Raymondbacteria bacterium RIFOXYC2_FULL_50_21]OGK01616.1 MAG: hypothetical protein A2350_06220 [Candidatus Raymondbacteria b